MKGVGEIVIVLFSLWWAAVAQVDGNGVPEETLESMVDTHMETLDRRASALWKQGAVGEAVKLYEEMAEYRPRHADSHFNVGIARYAMGEHATCMQAIDQALRLPSGVPHHSMYHQQMAACACKLGERQNDHIIWDKCIRHLAQSIYIDPQNVVAWATAATNYMALGYEQMAIRASDTAARLSPGPDALAALGINYARVGRYVEGIRCFQRALEANPLLHRTRIELLHAMSAVADWRGYDDSMHHVRTITQQQLDNNEYTFLQPFDALAHPIPNNMLRGIARAYALDSLRNAQQSGRPIFQHTPPPFPPEATPPASATLPPPSSLAALYPPHRRVHVGYVSADWTERAAVGRAISAGIRFHRRSHLLVTAYTLRNQRATGDFEYMPALKAAVERVVALDALTDEASAAQINTDGVHILANLGGYTSSARTEIFALHPAPLQILLQGFAGTSGAPYIEYNLLDPVQSPPEHAPFYTERLQRGCSCCQSQHFAARARAQRRFSKVRARRQREPRIFASWLSFLARTAGGAGDGAHLWMFRWPDALAAESNLKRAMMNVSKEVRARVVFTSLLDHAEKIRGKGVADLFLDTPEYNAHGTATEVLSGGVPVLTVAGGKAHSSRVAASVILALGLPELVARSLEDYQDIAVRLAQHPCIYAKTRAKLSRQRGITTLFDRRLWAQRMERSFMQIWDVWAAAMPPMHTLVAG